MKNKTKTYVLLAVVLGIWGIIGYKIVNGLSPDDNQVAMQDDLQVHYTPKKEVTKDTFSIQTIERDPFLGTLATKKRKTNKKASTPKSTTPEVNMPKIVYNGLIKEQNSSEPVFVITINNMQYLLKRGQEAATVKLIRGNAKEVVVMCNKKTLTISSQ